MLVSKTTQELEVYMNELYEKLKPLAESMGVYKPLNIHFEKVPPVNFEGEFCYTDEKGYHYGGISDRGEILRDNTTYSLFEVSYWAMSGVVGTIASEFERKNRVPEQDIRRILFDKKLELLAVLGENYRKRGEIDIDEILKIAPYQDHLFLTL